MGSYDEWVDRYEEDRRRHRSTVENQHLSDATCEAYYSSAHGAFGDLPITMWGTEHFAALAGARVFELPSLPNGVAMWNGDVLYVRDALRFKVRMELSGYINQRIMQMRRRYGLPQRRPLRTGVRP